MPSETPSPNVQKGPFKTEGTAPRTYTSVGGRQVAPFQRLISAECIRKRRKRREELRRSKKPLLKRSPFKRTVKILVRKSTGYEGTRFQSGVFDLLTREMQEILHRIFVNAATEVSINKKRRMTCASVEFVARVLYPDIIKVNRLTSEGKKAYRYLPEESIIYGSEGKK